MNDDTRQQCTQFTQTNTDEILEENSKLQTNVSKLENSNSSLNLRLQNTLDELKKLQTKITLQSSSLVTKDDEITTISRELTSTKEELNNKIKGHELVAIKVHKLEKVNRKLESEISTLKFQIEDYRNTKDDLEKQISAHLDFIKSFGEPNLPTETVTDTKLQEKIDDLNNENSMLNQKVQQYQAAESEKLKQKSKEINGLLNSNHCLSETIKDVKREVQEITDQLNIAKASLNCEHLLNATLTKQIEQKNQQLEERTFYPPSNICTRRETCNR